MGPDPHPSRPVGRPSTTHTPCWVEPLTWTFHPCPDHRLRLDSSLWFRSPVFPEPPLICPAPPPVSTSTSTPVFESGPSPDLSESGRTDVMAVLFHHEVVPGLCLGFYI